MSKNNVRKIIALALVFTMTLVTFTYADTVVIGTAPGMNDGRTMSANAYTPYLQNQITGPGTTPNSSSTNITPMQGVTYQESAGQNPIVNGTRDNSPTTNILYAPSTHVTGVTSNNSNAQAQTAARSMVSTGDSTSDSGPTVKETNITPARETKNDFMSMTNTPTATTTNNAAANTQQAATNQVVNTDGIIYTANDNIQAAKPTIEAPACLIVNATTRQIYFSKGGFTTYQPASLANLVTAAILVANRGLDDEITVSQTAVSALESGATTAGLKAGDKIKVRDALGAMFVGSCCDVANAVAENLAGSISGFVNVMNQTVKSWGCFATTFVNPSGLNNDLQLTTTYDMAVIMDKVTANPSLKVMLQQEAYILPPTNHRTSKNLFSRNKLLCKTDKNYYPGISASRMGYTSKTLYTIVSELDYNGQRLIAVVLKAKNSQWTDTKKLLNYAKIASLEPAAQNTTTFNTTFNTAVTSGATNVATTNQNTGAGMIESVSASSNQLPMGSTQSGSQAFNQDTMQGGNTDGAWAKDGNGWFFVKGNGSRAVNEWVRQNGKLYCVDSTGYMVTGWKQMSNGNVYYFDPTTGELRYNTWVNVSTGSYYLQADGSLAKADSGKTKNISTSVGTYTIDDTGKAVAKVS